MTSNSATASTDYLDENNAMTSNSSQVSLTYLADRVEPSLFRNGKVFIKRDLDGNDSDGAGVIKTTQSVVMHNARAVDKSEQPNLKQNGFELFNKPVITENLDFFDNQQILEKYYPECTEIVKQAVGAKKVLAFDHNVRSATNHDSKTRLEGGQQVQPPIQFVHADYTLSSAPQRLRDFAKPLGRNDTLRATLADGETLLTEEEVIHALDRENGGRFEIINLWRNISNAPIEKHPLGFCDSRTVSTNDLVVYEVHYADRIGENYMAKHSDQHQWYYYPRMTPDEALLLKTWDSTGILARSDGQQSDASNSKGNCTFSFHTAFEDPNTTDKSPERESIEVRCIALF